MLAPLVLAAPRERTALSVLGLVRDPGVLDDVDRCIAEIDENLIRNELSDLERAEHLQAGERL